MTRLLKGCPIKAKVGVAENVYCVHPGILSSSRGAHNARSKSPWKYFEQDTIDWTGFDCETIECVLSYLYTGIYSTNDLSFDVGSYMGEDETKAHQRDLRGTPDGQDHEDSSRELKSPPSNDGAIAKDVNKSPDHFDWVDFTTALRPLTPSKDPEVRAGVELLAHAKVLSFAKEYALDELSEYSLKRLEKHLATLDSGSDSLMPYLTEAFRLAYNTTDDHKTSHELARKLLTKFVASNIRSFQGSDIDILVSKGGEVTVDIFRELRRQTINREGEIVHMLELHTSEVQSMQRELSERDSLIRRNAKKSKKKFADGEAA